MNNNKIVKAQNLTKQFNGNYALNNINFSINAGEIFGFLGPSGSGKTTTINILTDQLNADHGDAYLFGKKVNQITKTDMKKIGIVSDQTGYYEKLSLYENMILYCKIFGIHKKKIDNILDKVGLLDSKKKPAEKLSKGMKQRMLLARALLNTPDILFLDEPTSGLDPTTTQKIHKLLLELKADGTTIFLTTHDMNEANFLCDHLALLNKGKIVEFGTPHEITVKNTIKKKLKLQGANGEFYCIEEKEETDDIIKKFFNSNQEIFSIHSCEPSLEDIFIHLTGEELISK